jgi:hypothetical protein
VTYQQLGPNTPADSYVQVFRTGTIEAVVASYFVGPPKDSTSPPAIFGDYLCNEVLNAAERFQQAGQKLEWSPPLVVMLTLIGVTGHTINNGDYDYGRYHVEVIHQDALLLPEVVVEEFPVDWSAVLRPSFDTMWQAAGYSECPLYSADGKWRVKR